MTEPRWLSQAEARAWLGYRRMRALLDLQITRDLARDSGLSEADYDVLSALSESDRHRLRLSDLAAHMLWSKSRLSHHVTRMQQRGLVARNECPSDGRGAILTLTEAGWQAIRDAAPAHVDSVRRNFIDQLSSEQIRVLGDLAEGVLAHLRAVQDEQPPGPQPAGQQPAARRRIRRDGPRAGRPGGQPARLAQEGSVHRQEGSATGG